MPLHTKPRRKLGALLIAFIFLLCIVITFAIIAPVKFINAVTPSSSFTKTANIAYGELPRQTLDIYMSKSPKPSGAPAPLLVFVHGGGWHSGDKFMYKFLAEGFTKDGYDIAVPNYRLYPGGIYPNMLRDTAKATAYIAEAYPDRPLILIGHSAGAYNVLMMGLAPEYMRGEGLDMCARTAGIISLAAPTGEIKLTSPRYVEVIPDRFHGPSAAINNLGNPSPPMLIVNGGQDTQVDPVNASGLAERMEAQGQSAALKIYETQSHNDLVKHLSRYFEKQTPLKSDIIGFIESLPTQGGFCQ